MSDWGAEQTRVQELLGENERLAEAYRDANELSEADLRRAGQAEAEVERLTNRNKALRGNLSHEINERGAAREAQERTQAALSAAQDRVRVLEGALNEAWSWIRATQGAADADLNDPEFWSDRMEYDLWREMQRMVRAALTDPPESGTE